LSDDLSSLRVAVVHDWLTGMRGGEGVLEAILDVVPQADIYTLFHFPGRVSAAIESHPIHTSFLQPLATRVDDYRKLLPLYPLAARQWDFRGYDLIVSSSHAVAKGVDARGLPHLCYCHTPMRYVWDRFDDYFPPSQPLRRLVAHPVAAALRRWDVRTADEVTRFVANSEFVRGRIRTFYGREAEVIHPFADEAFFAAPLETERDDVHLVVSALVPYKNIDLAIDAIAGSRRRLAIIGDGPLAGRLSSRAGPNVELLGFVSREEISRRMSRARSLILPGIEDFGITVVEAMAVGTPVVAYRGGGALDSVVEGRTGVFFDRFEVQSLRTALGEVERIQWDRAAIRAHAGSFRRAQFVERFRRSVADVIDRR
jgi:glycosyltransferase involved in cell wall biosynthesis